ncbi:unnamed protein product, partial [Amoebophrya sp. A25]
LPSSFFLSVNKSAPLDSPRSLILKRRQKIIARTKIHCRNLPGLMDDVYYALRAKVPDHALNWLKKYG